MPLGVELVFPPHWLPYQPYLALPALAGYLKANGHGEVHILDANVLATDWMLSSRFLAECRDRARERESSATAEHEDVLVQVLPLADLLVDEVEDAKQALRDPVRFYDPDEYSRAMRVLKSAFRLVSAAWWPLHISFDEMEAPYSGSSTRQIQAALADPDSDFYTRFFEEEILPVLRERKPGVIGLSMMCSGQVIPCYRLAHLAKRDLPGVHVVCGGSVPTALVPELRQRPELFDFIDSYVANDGEDGLLSIVRAVEAGTPIHGLPCVLSRKEGKVVVGPIVLHHGKDLPTPDFGDLPFEKYLEPEFIVHLVASRGCYYNKCTFCCHVATNVVERYRPMPAEDVVRDVQTIQRLHGARYFNFWDEAIAPSMLRRISEALLERGVDIRWNCLTKFEDKFNQEIFDLAARAGCLEITFGIESANPRVLEKMKKGIRLDVIRRILVQCRQAGIAANLYAMIGYPTETEAEAKETLDFVLENRDRVNHVIFSVFKLEKNTFIMDQMKEHGIERVVDSDLDLAVEYPYRVLWPGVLDTLGATKLSLEFTREAEKAGLDSPNSKAGAHFLLFLARGTDPVGGRVAPRTVEDPWSRRLRKNPALSVLGRAPNPRDARHCVFDRATWRTFLLPSSVLDLLERADGSKTGARLLDDLAPLAASQGRAGAREEYEASIQDLLKRGLLVVSDASRREEACVG